MWTEREIDIYIYREREREKFEMTKWSLDLKYIGLTNVLNHEL